MTDWTPEEDEAFNEVEKHSNLGKQILRDIEGQPYVYAPKRDWVGLTDAEMVRVVYEHTKLKPNQQDDRELLIYVINVARFIEAKLKEKNT